MDNPTYKYKAFISYSHKDKKFARWIHKQIENYKIPKSLREKYPNLPKNLKRTIFIDDEELPTASALPNNLSHALESSELLIVVCSPSASASYWVDKEIAYFKQHHGEEKILAILKEGEPNATYSTFYENDLEAFPKSLRYKVDNEGHTTDQRTEPLAGDARKYRGRKKAFIKLIAGILKVDFSDIWEREKRETRKRGFIVASILALFIAMSIYASMQFLGEKGNKELEQIKTKIALIEHSIRHDELPVEKVITLNEELKKLKVDKKNKEASQEALGKLKTTLGKKAQKAYQRDGVKSAIAVLTSKEAESNQESRLKEISKEKLALAKLYVETYQFDKADENYKKATELFFDFENGFAYTIVLVNQKSFKKAIEIYEKLLTTNLEARELAKVLTLLSNSYIETHGYENAEKALSKGLDIYRNLQKIDMKYSYDLGVHLIVLGRFYITTSKFIDADKKGEKALVEAVKIGRELVNNNEATSLLGESLGMLGILYLATNRYVDAEKVFLEVVDIHRKLVKVNPRENMPNLAVGLGSLSDLYLKTNRNTDAEKVLVESIELNRKLAKINPKAYNRTLATSLNSLGNLYQDIGRDNNAEKFFIEVIEIDRAIIQSNPEVYNNDLALDLASLGRFYLAKKQYSDAEKNLFKSVEMSRELAKINFKMYADDFGQLLGNLSTSYIATKKYGEAEKALLESIDIYRKLVKINSEEYSEKLAVQLGILGIFHQDLKRYKEAVKSYLKELEIRRVLAKQNPEKNNANLASALNRVGLLYQNMQQIKDAEKYYIETLEIRRILAKQNPNENNESLASALQGTLVPVVGTGLYYIEQFINTTGEEESK